MYRFVGSRRSRLEQDNVSCILPRFLRQLNYMMRLIPPLTNKVGLANGNWATTNKVHPNTSEWGRTKNNFTEEPRNGYRRQSVLGFLSTMRVSSTCVLSRHLTKNLWYRSNMHPLTLACALCAQQL